MFGEGSLTGASPRREQRVLERGKASRTRPRPGAGRRGQRCGPASRGRAARRPPAPRSRGPPPFSLTLCGVKLLWGTYCVSIQTGVCRGRAPPVCPSGCRSLGHLLPRETDPRGLRLCPAGARPTSSEPGRQREAGGSCPPRPCGTRLPGSWPPAPASPLPGSGHGWTGSAPHPPAPGGAGSAAVRPAVRPCPCRPGRRTRKEAARALPGGRDSASSGSPADPATPLLPRAQGPPLGHAALPALPPGEIATQSVPYPSV